MDFQIKDHLLRWNQLSVLCRGSPTIDMLLWSGHKIRIIGLVVRLTTRPTSQVVRKCPNFGTYKEGGICLLILHAAQPLHTVLKRTNCDEIICTIHRNKAHISVNLYRFLIGCQTETLSMISGCLAAKWVVWDARNALILCPDDCYVYWSEGLHNFSHMLLFSCDGLCNITDTCAAYNLHIYIV